LPKVARGALQVAGGLIPFAGGVLSAAAGYWSEREQQRTADFLQAAIQMLKDELREKEETIAEIAARLDLQDEKIAQRVRSDEYQSLFRQAFRKWSGAENKTKREYIRNLLCNAAATDLTSDDVVGLFIDWLQRYSQLHFTVIASIYQHPGSTRAEIWTRLGKGQPREDSADADLYKLLFRDLSTGSVIRQHRETDYAGNFLAKPTPKISAARPGSDRRLKSAFDDGEQYELTDLGAQFVHYVMTELTPKIEFRREGNATGDGESTHANG
jgi:hypothetical protein